MGVKKTFLDAIGEEDRLGKGCPVPGEEDDPSLSCRICQGELPDPEYCSRCGESVLYGSIVDNTHRHIDCHDTMGIKPATRKMGHFSLGGAIFVDDSFGTLHKEPSTTTLTPEITLQIHPEQPLKEQHLQEQLERFQREIEEIKNQRDMAIFERILAENEATYLAAELEEKALREAAEAEKIAANVRMIEFE